MTPKDFKTPTLICRVESVMNNIKRQSACVRIEASEKTVLESINVREDASNLYNHRSRISHVSGGPENYDENNDFKFGISAVSMHHIIIRYYDIYFHY